VQRYIIKNSMLSYEVYKILEEELGKEKADKVVRILEVILAFLDLIKSISGSK